MQILVACKYFRCKNTHLTHKGSLDQLSSGATVGGVVGRVVRTTDVWTELITTDVAPANHIPCPRCLTSQPMGWFVLYITLWNWELDFRAPGGIYYTNSYCASTNFWGNCVYENQYFGGGGGGIGLSVIQLFYWLKASRHYRNCKV